MEAPAEIVVFFDGACGLCTRAVRLLAALDRRGALRFAPLDGETARRLGVAGLAGDPSGLDTLVLVERDGAGCRTSVRSEAVLRAVRHLPGPWPLLARAAGFLPRPLLDGGYRLVARHRRRLGGEACALDRGALRGRLMP